MVTAAGGEGSLEICEASRCAPAEIGAPVADGARLRTDGRTRARVVLSDGSVIVLDRDTELSLEPRRAKLRSRDLEVTAQRSQITTGVGRLIANHLQASAETLVSRVERYELVAERIVERSHTALREVSDLLQTKSGRVRSFVGGVYAMYSGRTVMVSKKDTSIDGEKVLLG